MKVLAIIFSAIPVFAVDPTIALPGPFNVDSEHGAFRFSDISFYYRPSGTPGFKCRIKGQCENLTGKHFQHATFSLRARSSSSTHAFVLTIVGLENKAMVTFISDPDNCPPPFQPSSLMIKPLRFKLIKALAKEVDRVQDESEPPDLNDDPPCARARWNNTSSK
jgi:hypothetical protein